MKCLFTKNKDKLEGTNIEWNKAEKKEYLKNLDKKNNNNTISMKLRRYLSGFWFYQKAHELKERIK